MIRLSSLLILGLCFVLSTICSAQEAIPFHYGSLKEATERASAEERDFLVIIYSDTTNALLKNISTVLQDSVVNSQLNNRVLVLKEKSDSVKGTALLNQFGKRDLPLILFVSVEGEELVDFEGRVESDQFLDIYSRYVKPIE